MKKIIGLLALLLIFGCDDGDMTFESFNFTNAEPRKCPESELLYKVSGTEALVLNLDPSNFVNVVTPEGQPRYITVTPTSNSVKYLKFGADIGNSHQSVICNALPPFSPSEVWVADGGTIEVTTRANIDTATNMITGYTHTVRMVYLSFVRNEQSIIIQDNLFGDVVTPLGYTFAFNGNVSLNICEDNTETLYIISQREVLSMNLDNDALFQNVVTGPGEFREQVITADSDAILLNIYNGTGITAQVACGQNAISPQLTAVWEAYEGTVKVSTANEDGGFVHTIMFDNVKFRNTVNFAETFTLSNYTLGDTYNTVP